MAALRGGLFMTGAFSTPAPESPPVEQELVSDMARRALPVAPVVVLLGFAFWGLHGALSAAYGLAIVVGNFVLSALMLTWAGRQSMGVLMGTAMFGYVLRLGLVAVAVLVMKDKVWVELVPLGLTIIVTHVGLLFWETRHVSASLAYPGLKPDRNGA